ncbi:uncharacterized protein BJX67DRAFT_280950 [Aspergillus lucknowensis]|uniref:F-box domain-containing protein n=1 Tax=Aspergillus lucknowensis TaxID=176173 RepID=A0ABR4M0P0_9EURO
MSMLPLPSELLFTVTEYLEYEHVINAFANKRAFSPDRIRAPLPQQHLKHKSPASSGQPKRGKTILSSNPSDTEPM